MKEQSIEEIDIFHRCQFCQHYRLTDEDVDYCGYFADSLPEAVDLAPTYDVFAMNAKGADQRS